MRKYQMCPSLHYVLCVCYRACSFSFCSLFSSACFLSFLKRWPFFLITGFVFCFFHQTIVFFFAFNVFSFFYQTLAFKIIIIIIVSQRWFLCLTKASLFSISFLFPFLNQRYLFIIFFKPNDGGLLYNYYI